MGFSSRRFRRCLSTLNHMLTKACCEPLERRCLLSGEPQVTSSDFIFNAVQQELQFGFDQDVSSSLGTADLILKNVTSGQTIDTSDMSLIWDGAAVVFSGRTNYHNVGFIDCLISESEVRALVGGSDPINITGGANA